MGGRESFASEVAARGARAGDPRCGQKGGSEGRDAKPGVGSVEFPARRVERGQQGEDWTSARDLGLCGGSQ